MAGAAEAQAAYLKALEAVQGATGQQSAILNASPIDWTAAAAARNAVESTSDAAEAASAVYRKALLSDPAVTKLLATLTDETKQMNDAIAKLKKTAKTLNALATAADELTSTLKVLLKFVA